MSTHIEAPPAAAPATVSAIGLAYQLGELPLDLRRHGIPAVRDPGGNRLMIAETGIPVQYVMQYENPAAALSRLARGEDVRIVGLSLQYRRDAILVRADSCSRTVADLRSARIGIAAGGRPEEAIRKREAVRNVEIALAKAGGLPAELEWIELREPESPSGGRIDLQALLRGEVDAVFADGALAAEARRLIGVRELEDYHSYAPAIAVLTVSGGLVRERPEWAWRILAHASAAASWAYENRKEANRYAARMLGLPEDQIESVFSDRLHRQLGIAVTDDKWNRLVYWKRELHALGALERDIPLDDALDRDSIRGAQALIDAGGIELPQSEPITDYAERDLPHAFFFDRRPARVLRGDEEALEAARVFAEEIRPGASERDRRRKLPLEEMRRLAELGLLGLVVPRAYGGPEVSTRTLVDIIRLISHADGAIGQIPQNHHFFVKTIDLVGSEEQKRYFFEQVLKGAQFGNALAERGGGQGARRLSATIRPAADGDGFVLSGNKYYTTGALFSHWIPVTALDEEERRVTAFVARHEPGVTVLDDWSGIGQRTTASGSVILRDVRVPELQVLPHWKIFEGPQVFSAFGQIMHAAIDLGIAQAALEDAAAFVRERARPEYGSGAASAAEEPDLIRRFGELGIRLQAGEALLERAAGAIDAAGAELNAETAGRATLAVDSAKWFITETAVEITNALFEVAGTSSMDRKYNYDRHWRNVRIHTLHDPARLKLHHVGKWFLNGVYHEYKI
jgi:SfnB family sulfur acquisition oxidoreductase